MKTNCEQKVDLDERILKDPVDSREEEYRALKSEYLATKDAKVKDALVSKLFELASMYHEIGRDAEANRVYDEIVNYDKEQAEIIARLREMEPDIPQFKEMSPEDMIKYQQIVALTAAAGEGAYTKGNLDLAE